MRILPLKIMLTAAVSILLLAAHVGAERLGDRQRRIASARQGIKSQFGFRGGVNGVGVYSIEDDLVSFETKENWTAGIFADFPSGKATSLGLSIDLINQTGSKPFDDQSALSYEVAVNFKLNVIDDTPGFALKPGVAVGFGILPDLPVVGGDAYGLTGRIFLEGQQMIARSFGLVLEAGYWSVLTGNYKTVSRESSLRTDSFSFDDGGRVYARVGLLITPSIFQ